MSVVASFHLTRYPPRLARMAASRMAFDRPILAATPGLRFWRMLGTGRGRTMSVGADLCRWALFAVWDGERDLDTFLTSSSVAERWRRAGSESWSVRLAPAGGHGRWAGRDPFGDVAPVPLGPDEPVAVLTRAAIRVRRLPAFYRSAGAVDRVLRAQPGCLAAVGLGEWPLARQATFSLWLTVGEMESFAYRTAPHRRVVRRVRDEDWYAEEMFVRFRPYASSGTWDAADPLAGPRAVPPGHG